MTKPLTVIKKQAELTVDAVIWSEHSRGVRTLLDIADVITAALISDGIVADRAREVGMFAADQVRQTYGGDAIYIPRGLALVIDRRDLEIYGKYSGSNHFALAREYGMTVRQIYNIVARVRAAEFARRQMGLFE